MSLILGGREQADAGHETRHPSARCRFCQRFPGLELAPQKHRFNDDSIDLPMRMWMGQLTILPRL